MYILVYRTRLHTLYHCTCTCGPIHTASLVHVPYVNFSVNHHIYINTGGMALGGSYFGGGTGDVFFNRFVCSESTTRLVECSFLESQSELCSTHSNDAGVTCTGMAVHYCILKRNIVNFSKKIKKTKLLFTHPMCRVEVTLHF